MPAQALPAALQVPGLERELHDQGPPKDGCNQPALTQAYQELGLETRGLSENLDARNEEVNPQTLHALGCGEPVCSAVKVRSYLTSLGSSPISLV